jgi:hypothetical protein
VSSAAAQSRNMETNVADSFLASIAGRWRARIRRRVPDVMRLRLHSLTSFWVHRNPIRVTCLDGTLWITCEQDLNDYIVLPGQQFVARSRGQVVVHALSTARLVLERAQL